MGQKEEQTVMKKTFIEQLRNLGITDVKAIKHYYYKASCYGTLSVKQVTDIILLENNHIMFLYDDGELVETYMF